MKLAPIISATVIMYAGGLKWGNLSQLLPEALLSRIQNLAHRKSTTQKRKKIPRREEHENTLCFGCFMGIIPDWFHSTTSVGQHRYTEVNVTETFHINPNALVIYMSPNMR